MSTKLNFKSSSVFIPETIISVGGCLLATGTNQEALGVFPWQQPCQHVTLVAAHSLSPSEAEHRSPLVEQPTAMTRPRETFRERSHWRTLQFQHSVTRRLFRIIIPKSELCSGWVLFSNLVSKPIAAKQIKHSWEITAAKSNFATKDSFAKLSRIFASEKMMPFDNTATKWVLRSWDKMRFFFWRNQLPGLSVSISRWKFEM